MAAILFPVFSKAREKARQAACTSNLKQIALAAQIYTQENEEQFPTALGWASTIGVSGKVLICTTQGKNDAAGNSYGFSNRLGGKKLGEFASPESEEMVADCKPTTTDRILLIGTQVDMRHGKKALVAYADTHVELVSSVRAIFATPVSQMPTAAANPFVNGSSNWTRSSNCPGIADASFTQPSAVEMGCVPGWGGLTAICNHVEFTSGYFTSRLLGAGSNTSLTKTFAPTVVNGWEVSGSIIMDLSQSHSSVHNVQITVYSGATAILSLQSVSQNWGWGANYVRAYYNNNASYIAMYPITIDLTGSPIPQSEYDKRAAFVNELAKAMNTFTLSATAGTLKVSYGKYTATIPTGSAPWQTPTSVSIYHSPGGTDLNQIKVGEVSLAAL